MNNSKTLSLILAGALSIVGCGDSTSDQTSNANNQANGTHTHTDGTVHKNSDHAPQKNAHAHGEEKALAPITLGDMKIQLAQAHGAVQAGKMGHLVVKLPYSDKGQTIVRAWIGTEDRTLSMVGKGQYAPSHDDYDIHTTAPNPLPENVKWWIEIEKPDGTKQVGPADPIK